MSSRISEKANVVAQPFYRGLLEIVCLYMQEVMDPKPEQEPLNDPASNIENLRQSKQARMLQEGGKATSRTSAALTKF